MDRPEVLRVGSSMVFTRYCPYYLPVLGSLECPPHVVSDNVGTSVSGTYRRPLQTLVSFVGRKIKGNVQNL